MLTEIRDWLQRPFPFVQSYKQAVAISLIVGVFVTSFLMIFKPFGINRMESEYTIYLVGYGLIAFWVVYFCLQVMPVLLPGLFNEDKWNVFKNILLAVWILLMVSVFNWLYGTYLNEHLMGSHSGNRLTGFLMNVSMTFSLGVFPTFIISYILEKRLFAQNKSLARSIGDAMSTQGQSSVHRKIEIPIDYSDPVYVNSEDIICVKAEGGNYVTIYWNENGTVKEQLWRATLKSVLSMVESDEDILQCHKSYLINRSFVSDVTGNARTLIIGLRGVDFEVPVSRSFPRELVERYHLQPS